MKRTSAITLSFWLLVAQLVCLGQPFYAAGAGRAPKCCSRATPAVKLADQVGFPVLAAIPRCCHRECCARKSEPISQTASLCPIPPETLRFLPNVALLNLAWALPSPPVSLASAVPSSASSPRQPSVPVFTRHCAWLI